MSSCKCKNTDGVVMDKNGNTAFMNILGSITRNDIKNFIEKCWQKNSDILMRTYVSDWGDTINEYEYLYQHLIAAAELGKEYIDIMNARDYNDIILTALLLHDMYPPIDARQELSKFSVHIGSDIGMELEIFEPISMLIEAHMAYLCPYPQFTRLPALVWDDFDVCRTIVSLADYGTR